MNGKLEQQLRRALAMRAAELPADAGAKLLARDYRPRVAARRTPLALATITGAAAAAVLVVLLVGLSTGPPRAFAGWSAAPTHAAGAQLRRAVSVCGSLLGSVARRRREPGAHAGTRDPLPPPLPTRGWKVVLLDTRGPYTTVVLEADRGRVVSTCFVDRRGQASAGTSVGVRPPAPVPPGRIAFATSGSTSTPVDEGSRHFSMVVGRTGAGVTGVTLRLNNGTRVTASRAHGWFLAWWPGSHGLSATEVTTATGTRTQ